MIVGAWRASFGDRGRARHASKSENPRPAVRKQAGRRASGGTAGRADGARPTGRSRSGRAAVKHRVRVCHRRTRAPAAFGGDCNTARTLKRPHSSSGMWTATPPFNTGTTRRKVDCDRRCQNACAVLTGPRRNGVVTVLEIQTRGRPAEVNPAR